MSERIEIANISKSFEAHDLAGAAFAHADHVRVAYDLLRKYDFIDAAANYAKGVRAIASKDGMPNKFNLTLTYAFMSLIAELLSADTNQSFERFVRSNPDLMSKDILTKWYSKERLHSETALKTFLLPDVA